MSRRLWTFAPLLGLLLVVIAAGIVLTRGERGEKGGGLVGQPLPVFALSVLDGDRAVTAQDLAGRPLLINVFASWCAPCRVEHPALLQLEAEGVEVVGLAYKDAPEKTRAYLQELGDPYSVVLVDEDGRYGLEIGVTGVPETFAIGADGAIRAIHRGVLTPEDARVLVARATARN